MKSILIIGMGRFGHHLAKNFLENGHDVMIIDENEEAIEDMVPYATSSKIGDCTREEVLKTIGVRNFDAVFVCIGTNFQSSLEITCLLKELGAKYVISKATRDVHAKFLLRNGADKIIYPDRDIAEKCAVQYSSDNVFDYFELGEDFSIYELAPLPEWIGKTIIEMDIRNKYHTNIVAIQTADGIQAMPPANYQFKEEEHLLVMGKTEDIRKLVRKYDN